MTTLLFKVLVLGTLAGSLVSCGPPKGLAPGQVVTNGVVSFVSGEVQVQKDGAWGPLEPGTLVAADSIVKTGPRSACDLQFPPLGAVHLSESTTLAVRTVEISLEKKTVDLELTVGALVAKVAKLLGSDRFQVQTNTVVCGVRGTRFVVAKDSETQTTVAVAEGAVALVPPGYDPKIWDSLGAAAAALVAQVSPTLGPGTEVAVTEETLREAGAEVAMVQEAANLGSRSEGTLGALQGPGAPAAEPPAPAPENDLVSQALDTLKATSPGASAVPSRPLGAGARKLLDESADLKISGALPSW